MSLAGQDTASSFEKIPIIDINAAFSGDSTRRMALAKEIQRACIQVGFFYVSGHRISDDTIQSAVSAGKAFFTELSLEEKMELDIHKSTNYKGYTSLLSENTDPENGKGDLHEGFDIGFEPIVHENDHETRRTGSMSGTNVWPREELGLTNFRKALLTYYHAAVELGRALFPLFALALDLQETFFDDKTTQSAAVMRILRYPPQSPSEVDANSGQIIGIGAHTDYECFTILWQDNTGGLQVQNASGAWIDAVPIPGAFVVNIGDQLARWTNDVFKSTRHRATNKSGLERYSMPLFFGTDYDVMLEPIPSCVGPNAPPKYEVVKAGDYVKSRLDATYYMN